MNSDDILDKTPKGQEEIQSRKYKLPAKSRMLLLLVDGRQSAAQLAEQSVKLGVPEGALADLLAQGFVVPVVTPVAAPQSAPATALPTPPQATPAEATSVSAAPLSAIDRYREARNFMNESIVSALGLRSLFFTLQIEKTANLEDLHGLLDEYQRTMTKALGAKATGVLVARLKAMLEA